MRSPSSRRKGSPPRPPAQASPTRMVLAMSSPLTRLVVVADTHSRMHPDATTHIAALRPDYILHAGDIGDVGVIETLAEIAPVHAIRGNIDAHETVLGRLPDALSIDLADDERTRLRIYLTHIALYGPKLHAGVVQAAQSGWRIPHRCVGTPTCRSPSGATESLRNGAEPRIGGTETISTSDRLRSDRPAIGGNRNASHERRNRGHVGSLLFPLRFACLDSIDTSPVLAAFCDLDHCVDPGRRRAQRCLRGHTRGRDRS